MKKNAFTMAEMAIAFTILVVLTAVTVSNLKNVNMNKNKFYLYSTVKNIQTANSGLVENFHRIYPEEGEQFDLDTTHTDDWYCLQLSDMFSITGTPNCSKTAGINVPNFRLPNGNVLYGFATPWVASDSANPDFWYKNVMVDVDGDKGNNRLGEDRFPLRIYRGTSTYGADIEGAVYPACGNFDHIHDITGVRKNLTQPYCQSGFDFVSDVRGVTYDIYRADGINNNDTATLISSNLPALDAECFAYGGTAFYDKKTCSDANKHLLDKCAEFDMCISCSGDGFNVCPNGDTISACHTLSRTTNPNNDSCFVLLHRPSAGLGIFATSIINEIDM